MENLLKKAKRQEIAERIDQNAGTAPSRASRKQAEKELENWSELEDVEEAEKLIQDLAANRD
jgi:hypothetical protein